MAAAVLAPVTALHDRMTSPPSTPSSSRAANDSMDWEAKYHEVSELLQETRAELDEFQTSSKELEEELERELESTERQMSDLRNRVERVERERDDCKSKLANLQGTHNTTVNSLQRELDALRQQHALIKVQLRELEVGNDDLERSERAVSSSLADLEGRYAKALEEKIMLEHELQDRVALEEDMQRLRDELREANEETSIIKDQNTRLSDQYNSMEEQNRALSDEVTRLREELSQTQHLLDLAKSQPPFPSAPTTATSSAKSSSSHDSRPVTPSAASRTSDDLQLEDLVIKPKSPPTEQANATPRAKVGVLVSPSKRTMSVTRRPGTGIVTPTVVRTPNAHFMPRASVANNSPFTAGTPDPLRRSTTFPTLASPIPTRLPTARNSPALGAPAPRPRMPNGTATSSGLGPTAGTLPKRGTAVQMVGEMRARVRTLEQKINKVPLPKIRNPSLRYRQTDSSKENDRDSVKDKEKEKLGWKGRRSLDPGPQDSPGWVIVTDGPGKREEDPPSPSPLSRPPLTERGSFASQGTNVTHRPSFSSDRSRQSTHESPPPSAYRAVSMESQIDMPASGRVTPASTTGSTRVVSRSRVSLSGRTTPSFGISSTTTIFGVNIRRPLSRNSSRDTLSSSTNGDHSAVPTSVAAAPSLSRIPASPLPKAAEERNAPFRRPSTPMGMGMTLLPLPVDRSPSKSENLNVRRSTKQLSMHPGGQGARGTATSPTLPSNLTNSTRKVSSPPRAQATKTGSLGSTQNKLAMSRIGRPNSVGVTTTRTGAAVKDKAKDATGRFRSGSVGWNRER